MTQGTFRFSAPEKARLRVPALIQALDGKGWRKRRDLERELGWTERDIRDVANAAQGYVIGTNRGYRLTYQASPAECDRAEKRMKHQIDAMTTRLVQIRNARNRPPRWEQESA